MLIFFFFFSTLKWYSIEYFTKVKILTHYIIKNNILTYILYLISYILYLISMVGYYTYVVEWSNINLSYAKIIKTYHFNPFYIFNRLSKDYIILIDNRSGKRKNWMKEEGERERGRKEKEEKKKANLKNR